MGLYLAQLPPAELARLKAELAETLIANFCYPRFLDYRTNTLRMRPVDRAKRQEVWSFLSSYDFSPWGRIDVQSQEFHRLVERLLIQYIQRNRAFFGNQGRKRMSDVRNLIGASAVLVTEGLRLHLTGRPSQQGGHAFGSPRPVISWNDSALAVATSWEQIANATQQLQFQLQVARGEIHPESENEAHVLPASPPRPATMPAAPPRRSPRNRASSNGSGKMRAASKPTGPLDASHIGEVETIPLVEKQAPPVEPPAPPPALPIHQAPPVQSSAPPPALSIQQAPQVEPPAPPLAVPAPQAPNTMRELSRVPAVPQSVMPTPPGMPAALKTTDGQTVMISEEDVVIFEQLRHQLIVWLRVEAVRHGLDIADQSPLQLINLLRSQEGFDEARLQVVTTLLHLADSVSARGQATLIDYKQAMMFYLMHTRSAR